MNPRKNADHPRLAPLRAALAGKRGRDYWMSLEELTNSGEFRKYLEDEFPEHASEPPGVSRREMFRVLGASLALAGLSGCTVLPNEKIVPYVDPPEEIVPGVPLYFASTMPMSGRGLGIVVESHMGRPTKVEGNPRHPSSLGATDAFAQASILGLYDPDRSQTLSHFGRIGTWPAFLNEIKQLLADEGTRGGAGARILVGPVSSPVLLQQLQQFQQRFPNAKVHAFDPAGAENARAGAQLAFGRPVNTVYRFDRADVVLSIDSDFVSGGPETVRYSHDLASRRRVREGQVNLGRLYVVESTPSCTGGFADNRLALRPSQIETAAWAAAAALGIGQAPPGAAALSGEQNKWLQAAIQDLQQNRGRSIVIAGREQAPAIHALAHAINDRLGNTGNTLYYTEPLEADFRSLGELAADMQAGTVNLLIIAGENPVYSAPADLEFLNRMGKVKTRVHLGLYNDETADYCQWHIPEAHYLESWGDVRAYDGTVSLIQPLIAPLYGGRTATELLSAMLDPAPRTAHDIVHDYWKGQSKGGDFEPLWSQSLQQGFFSDSALPPVNVRVQESVSTTPAQRRAQGLEIQFRPDPTVWDGRFNNNAWLQELPKPLTKLTWDNTVYVSPATASRHGLRDGELVDVRYRGRSVRGPIWTMPGQADDCVTVLLGYGRTRAGRVGSGAGYNAYAIRTSDAPWQGSGVELRKTGQFYPLAQTQGHFRMEGRDLVRAATIEEYRKNPGFAQGPPAPLSLYPEYKYDGYKWAMAIDLTACTGCSACVVACQAENNIPVVGKDQVVRGREMHWLRIDRYFQGGLEDPAIHVEPVPCMHCEKAPCEVVCPVGATVHSPEGLNEMVYNRCVGTRYCSNNCPYKVRRFNFYHYTEKVTGSLKLLQNPDVTVRSRGVMEKCTYCVQRLKETEIQAEKEGRRIREGEVTTACAQACPTQAIVFGDLNSPKSAVAKLKALPLNYGLLTELTTQPRTTYLAKVRNPNPGLARPGGPEGEHGA